VKGKEEYSRDKKEQQRGFIFLVDHLVDCSAINNDTSLPTGAV
jgi:hypothetical protein